VPNTSLTCPSCSAVLKMPDTIPVGAALKCPKCAARFRRGTTVIAAPVASEFWETVQLDDLGAAAPPKPPVSAKRTTQPGAVPKPNATARRTAVPRPPAGRLSASHRGLLIGVTTGAIGLSCGLIVALWIAIAYRTPADSQGIVQASPKAPSAPEPPTPEPPAQPSTPKTPTVQPSIPNAPQPPAWAYEHWLQDPSAAQKQAKEESKDVYLLFDWSDPGPAAASEPLTREVFARPELWKRLTDRFVVTYIDFPEFPAGRRRVQDARRNEVVQARFFKNPTYPRAVLTDADGRPYAVEYVYKPGTAEEYVGRLENAARSRVERDEMFAAVPNATGAAKLVAAREALDYLIRKIESPTSRGDGTYVFDLREFYGPLLLEWRSLADTHDPDNKRGDREYFFWHDWVRRVNVALTDQATDAKALRSLADEFATWSMACRPREGNCGVSLWERQATLLGRLNEAAAREKAIRAALELNPSQGWRDTLTEMLQSPRANAGSSFGTGFVAASGYVVTNAHVVEGAKALKVRPEGATPMAATLVARDAACDLALLKFTSPAGSRLKPAKIAPAAPTARGTEVGTLGFALGANEAKLTRGMVSQRSAAPNRPTVLYLDLRVNPGNSGGPLFDVSGNVIGVVSAKSMTTATVDSYGLALSADTLDKFLREHLPKEYKAAEPLRGIVDWSKLVEERISPSVVQVIGEP
jgi:S1-C subfamily serine protease